MWVSTGSVYDWKLATNQYWLCIVLWVQVTKNRLNTQMVQCIRLHFHIQLVYVCMHSLCRNLEYICTESGKPFDMAGKLDSGVIMFGFLSEMQESYSNRICQCSSTLFNMFYWYKTYKHANKMKIQLHLTLSVHMQVWLTPPSLTCTALLLQYSRTVSARVHIYVYAHDKCLGNEL